MRHAEKPKQRGKEEAAGNATTNDISDRRSAATAVSEVRLSTTSKKNHTNLIKTTHTHIHTHTERDCRDGDTNIILRIYLQFNISQRSESANLAIAELHDK